MSDCLADSEALGRNCCPGCEPEADFVREILITTWCHRHRPSTVGAEDGAAVFGDAISGASESGGATNRALGDLLHRGQRPRETLPPDPPDYVATYEADA